MEIPRKLPRKSLNLRGSMPNQALLFNRLSEGLASRGAFLFLSTIFSTIRFAIGLDALDEIGVGADPNLSHRAD